MWGWIWKSRESRQCIWRKLNCWKNKTDAQCSQRFAGFHFPRFNFASCKHTNVTKCNKCNKYNTSVHSAPIASPPRVGSPWFTALWSAVAFIRCLQKKHRWSPALFTTRSGRSRRKTFLSAHPFYNLTAENLFLRSLALGRLLLNQPTEHEIQRQLPRV